MSRKFFSILFLMALAFPFTASADPVPGLLGRWVAEHPVYDRDVRFNLAFDFQERRTTMSVGCYFRDGAYLETAATTSVRYDENRIQILVPNEGLANDGFHYCRATLNRSTWEAYFDGTGKMVLFLPFPYPSRISLVREFNGTD